MRNYKNQEEFVEYFKNFLKQKKISMTQCSLNARIAYINLRGYLIYGRTMPLDVYLKLERFIRKNSKV